MRERRAAWVRLEQDYWFDTPHRAGMSDLSDGRRQLLVQHFMLGPGWLQGA